MQRDASCAASDASVSAAPNAQRDRNGRFLPGHSDNARHFLETDRVPATYLEMSAALLEQSITDDGGRSEIPARRLSQHEYRALVHRKVWQLSDALDARGLFDKRGKLRVAWIQRLEALITLATRIDATLGLERRQRTVASPLDYINGRAGV